MSTFKSFIPKLYGINDGSFDIIALELFRFQAAHNPLYRQYLEYLRVRAAEVTSINEIPFLPISLFKTHTIRTGEWVPETTFLSSGTTGTVSSRHEVADTAFYLNHSKRCFEHFFGPVDQYHFLALLPSYLERSGSSLISMLRFFIEQSGSPDSGFFLFDHDGLLARIDSLRNSPRRTILWGVSFALLEMAERQHTDLGHCMIFETGGMKGRRKEITREELHLVLRERLNADVVYSEYGMTELFSQAYTKGGNKFYCPPLMKIVGRDLSDPLRRGIINETAGLNIIDLANVHSIAFIGSEDQGKVFADGSFEVLGRVDNSDIRGCNLLV